MLTVKVMTAGGGEEIISGSRVGYNPEQHSISIAGFDNNIFLRPDQVAYIMNDNGKTISKYDGVLPDGDVGRIVVRDGCGTDPDRMRTLQSTE